MRLKLWLEYVRIYTWFYVNAVVAIQHLFQNTQIKDEVGLKGNQSLLFMDTIKDIINLIPKRLRKRLDKPKLFGEPHHLTQSFWLECQKMLKKVKHYSKRGIKHLLMGKILLGYKREKLIGIGKVALRLKFLGLDIHENMLNGAKRFLNVMIIPVKNVEKGVFI